jgi:hypothetical protein
MKEYILPFRSKKYCNKILYEEGILMNNFDNKKGGRGDNSTE